MTGLPVLGRALPRPAFLLASFAFALSLVSVLTVVAMLDASSSDAGGSFEPSVLATEAEPDDIEEVQEVVADTPIALPMAAVEMFLPRDPFEPVVEPDEVVVDDNGDPVAPGDDPSDPDAPQPSPPGTPGTDDPDGTQTARCSGDSEIVCDGVLLVLEDIRDDDGDQIAVIVVDDVTFQVRPGERFAGSFELLRIDVDSVRLLYGDEVFSLPLLRSVMK